MNISLIAAVVICLIALVITLTLTQIEDKNYDSNKSIANLALIYIVFLPALLLVIGVLWFIL
ncbi:BshB3 potential contributor to bacillithiol synthesis [Bacillus piscicola]|uniref:BshB3 potential contributor to bacillithiol synthesis n=1 Tax=Bacillus piscicola TaxID=1632684 RepID=UPI001F08E5BB|nr:BshB3 potential contributor to bacillithiol synthesis [Bacillus piscicola]